MTRVLLDALASELCRGVEIIARIDDDTYRQMSPFTGSIGGQFRHNFDIAGCLVKGFTSGRIDYSDRERDIRIECDRAYATGCFAKLIDRFRGAVPEWLPCEVRVRSETQSDVWFRSDLVREIESVYSHTIHHHALIAEKLSSSGLAVPPDFGVALSTLEYWQRAA